MLRSHRLSVSLALAIGFLVGCPSVRADDLPPQTASAYTAVYKSTTRGKEEPTAEKWDFTTEDTVTIAVSGARSRWDHKSDGRIVLNDYEAKTFTEIGGRHGGGKALRLTYRTRPIRWELGYAAVAGVTENKPEVLGTDTIAGQSCTRLKYSSEQFGTPEYCVAKNGVVLRFANRSDNAETSYEAVSLTPDAPDEKRFALPEGLDITERQSQR